MGGIRAYQDVGKQVWFALHTVEGDVKIGAKPFLPSFLSLETVSPALKLT